MSSDAWTEGTIEANGVSLHYHRTGGDKPSMIMLHGLNDSGLCWTPIARRLETDFDIIMLDLRGHGKSVAPSMDFGFELMADDVATLIKELDLHEPVLLGHSIGALAATITAAKYPALVSKLVLEDAVYIFISRPKFLISLVKPFYLWFAKRADKKTIDQIKAAGKKKNPTWPDEEFEPWVIAQKDFAHNVKTIKIGRVDLLTNWNALFPKILCPVLMIISSNGFLKLKTSEKIKPRFGSTQVNIVYIEGAGHSIRRDQPDKFMETVKEFCMN